jgi:hypothetical protein
VRSLAPRAQSNIVCSRRLSNRGARPLKLTVRFHMTARAVLSTILSISLANSASAKCAYHAEVLATVAVRSCIAVTFSATDSKYVYFPGDAPSRIYRVGASLSGTLLTVSVKTSKLVWPADTPHFSGGTRAWNEGEYRDVFVQAAPGQTCPEVLPVDATVQTQPTCCDVTPGGEECLLPRTISLVTLSTHRKRA